MTAPAIQPDWALFLDVDGTLLDIAPTPDSVVVPPDLVAALTRLYHHLGGALALVSGRPIAQLDELFAPLRLPAAGEHGAEWRPDADADTSEEAPLAAPLLAAIEALANDFPRARIEPKRAAIALHYRAAPELGPAVETRLRALLMDHPQVELLGGRMVWEVRPRGVDKGVAVHRFMATRFAGRVPVFVGDDRTDADGFAAAVALGGLALPVGDLHRARWGSAFAAPEYVRAWLSGVAPAAHRGLGSQRNP